ncbi:hypothetical protein RUM43_009346, partial [Polyplax serrata]
MRTFDGKTVEEDREGEERQQMTGRKLNSSQTRSKSQERRNEMEEGHRGRNNR